MYSHKLTQMCQTISFVIILTVLLSPCGECCGPGRGGGRRRSARKLTPLVYKQHVPNVAESTLGASGLVHGRISRDDPRFSHLVPNYNADILFSDEEGTGADRLMTERCRERLNILAVMVMNQWPGVRLRVTEGWDEGTMHAPNSLHYEGRAVDITTSDKDFTKQGMLARLAVQSGFDWVYYESRSRVHCSVKSEIRSRKNLGGCFPGSATVETPNGARPLKQIQEGDKIKVLKSDGTFSYSPVLLFIHKDPEGSRSFLSLETSSGRLIKLTPSHLVFRVKKEVMVVYSRETDVTLALRHGEAVLAGSVIPGDFLLVKNTQNYVTLERLVNMTSYLGDGVFAPLTSEGTVVIDGVVASCYAVIDSQFIAHWSFLPIRTYYHIKDAINSIWEYISHPNTNNDQNTITIDIIKHPKNIYKKNNLTYKKKYIKDITSSNKNLVIDKNNYINKKAKDKIIYRDNTFNNSISDKNTHRSKVDEKRHFDYGKYIESEVHIHWYPKLLYTVASWVLPSHLVYA